MSKADPGLCKPKCRSKLGSLAQAPRSMTTLLGFTQQQLCSMVTLLGFTPGRLLPAMGSVAALEVAFALLALCGGVGPWC